MKKIIIFMFLILFLSGCGFSNMEKGLTALMGKDATTAFNVIGYPTGKNEFGNKTIYFWSVNRTTAMILPQTSTTYGTVGMTPVYGTTTSSQVVPMTCSCLLRLIADENDKLISWDYNGNLCGCDAYISRLSSYYENQKKLSSTK